MTQHDTLSARTHDSPNQVLLTRSRPVKTGSMKALLLLFLSLTLVCAAGKPTVDIYQISQRDTKAGTFPWPEVILEIANPTDKIFYLDGQTLESPAHDIEALRGDRWLRIPAFVCGTGMARRPLKPGARMLVTVQFPWQEKAARFRFYFYSTQDWKTGEVISVRSRGIEKKSSATSPAPSASWTLTPSLKNPSPTKSSTRHPPHPPSTKIPSVAHLEAAPLLMTLPAHHQENERTVR